MKILKSAFWIMLTLPFILSCNQKKIEQLELRNDSLVNQANLKEASINEFLAAFNEIQGNLDSIKATEMIITEATGGKTELKKAQKDQINEDINKIYELLLENKQKVASLKKQLGNTNFQIGELEKMIDNLGKEIEVKDAEIEQLRADLEKMNIKITKLTQDVEELTEENEIKSGKIREQAEEIENQTIELNTGFYVVGGKKELMDSNVITKEGGFIGIGASKVIRQDFNEGLFKKIDIREFKKLNMTGKKVEIVSTHPAESYTLAGDKGNWVLQIKDYKAFWKSSKYLVVVSD
ncbi:MAG: hypothetical protein JXA03_01770, partial [Bacteroidales bacterium]|nr:hypothetical protein [Bacteroidales bacterium]